MLRKKSDRKTLAPARHGPDRGITLAGRVAVSCVALGMAVLLVAVVPTAASEEVQTVVVLFPENAEGSPGSVLVSRSLQRVLTAGAARPVQLRREYLDLARFEDPAHRQSLAAFLERKYARQRVDLVMAGLASSLDFVVEYRQRIFPGVPVVFIAVDEQEIGGRTLPPDVIGVPARMDLAGTLDLGLRSIPETRQVFVVVGRSSFDAHWEARARDALGPFEQKVTLTYLAGLPMDELLARVRVLPPNSIIQYLHIFEDGTGKTFIPAEALDLLSAAANAPIFGHVDSYVGRGIVGGRVMSFEAEGTRAAELGLRILAGERPEAVAKDATRLDSNVSMVDWRQMRRWGLNETRLPPDTVVRNRVLGVWDLYRWQIVAALAVFLVQTALIVALLVQRARRRRAEAGLRRNQVELRRLGGRLLQAHEDESRRIARELHDDLGQGLALLTVEMDLLRQHPAEDGDRLADRMQDLVVQVKHLSSSVHGLSHQLHPSKLEQLGLVAALRSLCLEAAQLHRLPIDFVDHEVPEALPPELAVCLYRIAQEALRNVVKHSGAGRAEVTLLGNGVTLALEILDDGRGFDPGVARGKGGLGLVSMRERALHVAGELVIGSRPSEGTRIAVSVPLGGAASV